LPKLSFRTLRSDDKDWLTEIVNDPEVAKYSLSIYPRTEHEVEEFLRKDLDDGNEAKHVVAEVDGEPAGAVDLWWRAVARDRHVASVGICVRRKHWGKGVGYGLMKEAERIGKELGLRKLVLGVFSGNDRALRLYEKSGYRQEACEHEEVYIDGSWRDGYYMTLELAKCEPRHKAITRTETKRRSKSYPAREGHIQTRQLGGKDLDEVNRLQNCTVSTKSSFRIPPVTKEETKRWYEGIKSEQGKYCIACFDGDRLLGYLHFRTLLPPFVYLRLEEIIVDEDQRPSETANALVAAFKNFKERYWYHRVFACTPETSSHVINALKQNGFKKSGAISSYYYVDGYYVDMGLYG
jgi:RimJ/RimL family protein N-acetyltransferase